MRTSDADRLNVTKYGYTNETFALAEELHKNKELRDNVLAQLSKFNTPITYSNEDFDRTQGLAAMLAEVLRASVERSGSTVLSHGETR